MLGWGLSQTELEPSPADSEAYQAKPKPSKVRLGLAQFGLDSFI